MKWTRGTVTTTTRNNLTCPLGITISICDGLNGQRYLWADMMLGVDSDASPDECMQTWPREAIVMFKQKISELETYLNKEEEENETNLEK